MNEKSKKLSTDPYKGVRDFFPEDMAIQNAIFGIWRDISEKYGYEQYDASVLEPADLYRAKTGEEIVNEQTYTFTDRGDREVTLRPEMTPTVARMVAARKRELAAPVRWFSMPNLFRYEQPQRGRVREHWQLNVDIFGVESISAEVEILNMAYDITRAYGLTDTDFEIRINSRKIVNYVMKEVFAFSDETAHKVAKLIDKKNKMSADGFKIALIDAIRPSLSDTSKFDETFDKFLTLLSSKNFEEFTAFLPQSKEEHEGIKEVRQLIASLENLGITNVRFDQTIMRGFDYYTGIVFEVYDMNPANRRSIFGGGRYDNLLSLFGNDRMPAVGFGAGDVIARDLMETYGTLPGPKSPADIGLVIVGEQNQPYAMDLAQLLRSRGIRVSVDLSGKKVGDQIASAAKRNIPKIIAVGDEETRTGKLRLKNLATGEETLVTESDISK